MSTARVTLLSTDPTVAPGVLSLAAWRAVESAEVVLARDDMPEAWVTALGEATDALVLVGPAEPAELADLLAAQARVVGSVLWFGSADGDDGLTRALTASALTDVRPVELESVVGSWSQPGSAVLELVSVMDTLRSPGGCPWDAEQTHASLVPYALEEAYEVAEAVELGDRDALREELGDLLLQVAFHARVASEHPDDPFDVDDVARGITAKLRRRHPHVFADGSASTAAEVETSWHAIKATEKGRASVLDGVPVAMPALARAAKVLGRIERAGLPGLPEADGRPMTEWGLGRRLLRLTVEAYGAGVDAETALRCAVRDLETHARAAEAEREATSS